MVSAVGYRHMFHKGHWIQSVERMSVADRRFYNMPDDVDSGWYICDPDGDRIGHFDGTLSEIKDLIDRNIWT